MKKYYSVSLISKTVQTKFVRARNKVEAQKLVEDIDWMEKEEMIDSEIKVECVMPSSVFGRCVWTAAGVIGM